MTPQTPYGALVAVLSAKQDPRRLGAPRSASPASRRPCCGASTTCRSTTRSVPIQARLRRSALHRMRAPGPPSVAARLDGGRRADARPAAPASTGPSAAGVADWKWYKPWKANPYVQMGMSDQRHRRRPGLGESARGRAPTGEKTPGQLRTSPVIAVLDRARSLWCWCPTSASRRVRASPPAARSSSPAACAPTPGATVTVSLRQAPELRGLGSRRSTAGAPSTSRPVPPRRPTSAGRLTILAYGVAGPYAQARVAIVGTADSTANPWWHIDADGAAAGAGVRVRQPVLLVPRLPQAPGRQRQLVKGRRGASRRPMGPDPKAVEQAPRARRTQRHHQPERPPGLPRHHRDELVRPRLHHDDPDWPSSCQAA